MANQDIVHAWGLASRALPSRTSDGAYAALRTSNYGEVYTRLLDRAARCDDGQYFAFHNITNDAATTLAGHPAPVLVDADATMTKPIVFMRYAPSATTSHKRVILDYIEIEVITAAASGTEACWAAQLDTGSTRYSSGTVETATVVNCNMQSTNTSELVTFLGPVVVGAESASVRRLGFGSLRPTIEIAGDKKIFLFGRDAQAVTSTAATTVREQIVNLPPVVLGSTDQFLLAIYGASTGTAGVYKIRGGYVEA